MNGDEEFDEAGRDDDVEEASFRGSQCKPVIEKKSSLQVVADPSPGTWTTRL